MAHVRVCTSIQKSYQMSGACSDAYCSVLTLSNQTDPCCGSSSSLILTTTSPIQSPPNSHINTMNPFVISTIIIIPAIFLAFLFAFIYIYCIRRRISCNNEETSVNVSGLPSSQLNNAQYHYLKSKINLLKVRQAHIPRTFIESNTSQTCKRPILNISNPGLLKRVKAVEEHRALMEDELSVKINELITIIDEYDDGWAYGHNITQNTYGIFPIIVSEVVRP